MENLESLVGCEIRFRVRVGNRGGPIAHDVSIVKAAKKKTTDPAGVHGESAEAEQARKTEQATKTNERKAARGEPRGAGSTQLVVPRAALEFRVVLAYHRSDYLFKHVGLEGGNSCGMRWSLVLLIL